MTANEHLEALLKLPLAERAAMTAELARSLDDGPELSVEDWRAAWNEEIDKRIAGIESGDDELIPDDEVWAGLEEVLVKAAG